MTTKPMLVNIVKFSQLEKIFVNCDNEDIFALKGYNKPVHVSAELANFLGIEQSRLVSRNDVARFIFNYIKTNDLEDKNDRRFIIGDDNLNTLLKRDETQDLRYPTLQQYLKRHYVEERTPNEKASRVTTVDPVVGIFVRSENEMVFVKVNAVIQYFK